MSGKCPGNVREMSGKCLGEISPKYLAFPRKILGSHPAFSSFSAKMSGRVAGNTPKIASKIVGAQHKSETNVREMSGKCLAEILHQKPSILWAGSKNLGFQDRRRVYVAAGKHQGPRFLKKLFMYPLGFMIS